MASGPPRIVYRPEDKVMVPDLITSPPQYTPGKRFLFALITSFVNVHPVEAESSLVANGFVAGSHCFSKVGFTVPPEPAPPTTHTREAVIEDAGAIVMDSLL